MSTAVRAFSRAPAKEFKTPIDRLSALVAEDMKRVDALIYERMASQAPMIPTLAAHLIGAGGKRLRPMLTLATAAMCGYRGDHHVKLAATVEFIHSATLLHDDVVDESDLRRGRKTANLLWGNKPSILVGDYLFSRSFQLMVETDSLKVLGILADASAVIAEGEVMQLSTANNLATTSEQYLKVIRAKTAALFAAAAEVGGVVAGVSEARQRALHTYGDRLGVAFQLVDDVLDYAGDAQIGKNVGDDFREGKVTRPVMLAYARGDEDERAFWRRVIEKRDQRDGDLQRAFALVDAHGGVAEAREEASSYAAEAKAALIDFPDGPMREALVDVVDFVVARAY